MERRLEETITDDLKNALKQHDALRVSVLRLLLAAIHNETIKKRSAAGGTAFSLGDGDVLGIVKSESKKRKEAAKLFRDGKREDLAAKEEQELAIIQAYAPRELNDEELEKIVLRVLQATGDREFGKAMKAVMGEVKGRADGSRVAAALKAHLKEMV